MKNMQNVPEIKVYYSAPTKIPVMSKKAPYKLQYLKLDIDYTTGVALVTFNMPKKLNPITDLFVWEHFFMLEYLKREDKVKAVVWTGAGRAFSSGAAFSKKTSELDPKVLTGYVSARKAMPPSIDVILGRLVRTFMNFPKCSIAAVNGIAVGGGVNHALFCHDIVLAADSATFKYPFVQLGIVPELGSSFSLQHRIGSHRAKEIFYTGRAFTSQEAYSWGLVNRVVPKDQVLSESLKMAEKIAKNAKRITPIKKLVNASYEKQVQDALAREEDVFADAICSRECQVAMMKFAQKHSMKKKKHKSKL